MRTLREAMAGCTEYTQSDPSGQQTTYRVSALGIGTYGDESYAFTTATSIPPLGNVVLQLVVIRRGDVLSAVGSGSYGQGAPDAAFTESLVRRADEKLTTLVAALP